MVRGNRNNHQSRSSQCAARPGQATLSNVDRVCSISSVCLRAVFVGADEEMSLRESFVYLHGMPNNNASGLSPWYTLLVVTVAGFPERRRRHDKQRRFPSCSPPARQSLCQRTNPRLFTFYFEPRSQFKRVLNIRLLCVNIAMNLNASAPAPAPAPHN